MKVGLQWWEARDATLRALDAITAHHLRNLTHTANRPRLSWWEDVAQQAEGYAAELVVARSFGWYLPPHYPGAVHTGDVDAPSGPVEVRHTTHPTGRLLVRDTDPDDRWVFLVRGSIPELEICGAIRADEARRVGTREAPGGRPPAFFVSADRLSWRT